jgi:putative intracellular protease/amidase
MRRVLMPLADRDFDVTEVVVPWNTLRNAGYDVIFATEGGTRGRCDPLLLTGVVFGQLGARPENVALYRELEGTEAFQHPIRFSEIRVEDYAGVALHGGHAPGMRQYLECGELQQKIVDFFRADKPVAAICHAAVLLARSVDPATGRSVVHGRRMTGLPKALERTSYLLTFWKLGRYYRTYPEYVADEAIRALGDPALFLKGPLSASYDHPFTVRDRNLITARWPGDAQKFAEGFVELLRESNLPRDHR